MAYIPSVIFGCAWKLGIPWYAPNLWHIYPVWYLGVPENWVFHGMPPIYGIYTQCDIWVCLKIGYSMVRPQSMAYIPSVIFGCAWKLGIPWYAPNLWHIYPVWYLGVPENWVFHGMPPIYGIYTQCDIWVCLKIGYSMVCPQSMAYIITQCDIWVCLKIGYSMVCPQSMAYIYIYPVWYLGVPENWVFHGIPPTPNPDCGKCWPVHLQDKFSLPWG